MSTHNQKHLHWTQRIALTQHNLHAAPRTGNYAFFSTLQAHYYLDGHDPVASLNATLSGEADRLFTVLDNISSGIAWAYEDAFKAVYDNLRVIAGTPSTGADSRERLYALQFRLQLDITQHREAAEAATDKMISNATTLIQQQPPAAQDDAAHVLCLGTSFVADAIQICLAQLEVLKTCLIASSSAIDRDESWVRADKAFGTVRFAVSSATSALKGILNMMETHDDPAGEAASQALHSQESVPSTSGRNRGNTTSTESSASGASTQGWNVLRRMSTAISGSIPPSRKASIVLPASLPSTGGSFDAMTRRGSVASTGTSATETQTIDFTAPSVNNRVNPPLKNPAFHKKRAVSAAVGTVLSPIPPTPQPEGLFNPFEATLSNRASANDNFDAYASNCDSAPLTPCSPSSKQSENSATRRRPSPTPQQHHHPNGPSPKSISNDALTRTRSGNAIVLGIPSNQILDLGAADMGPGPAQTRAHSISTPPLSRSRGPGRRRSVTVTGQPPTPEELFPAVKPLQAEEAVV